VGEHVFPSLKDLETSMRSEDLLLALIPRLKLTSWLKQFKHLRESNCSEIRCLIFKSIYHNKYQHRNSKFFD
jgi:hypothetical protein